jgi:hypothetical protein
MIATLVGAPEAVGAAVTPAGAGGAGAGDWAAWAKAVEATAKATVVKAKKFFFKRVLLTEG